MVVYVPSYFRKTCPIACMPSTINSSNSTCLEARTAGWLGSSVRASKIAALVSNMTAKVVGDTVETPQVFRINSVTWENVSVSASNSVVKRC